MWLIPSTQYPPDVVDDDELIWAISRYAELAKGAYAKDDASLRERTGLEESYIYHADFQESNGSFPRPAFFLAVDDHLQALVLSIRGTKSALEVQIDAKWNPIEFPQMPGAFVHEGIYLAARWFVDSVLGRLTQLSSLFPDYKIRIVGHSLGAGIAALFSLMIREVLPHSRAVLFAPPACVSAKLVPLCKECCISFVNQTDVLPYLTQANLTSFFTRKKIVHWNEELHSREQPKNEQTSIAINARDEECVPDNTARLPSATEGALIQLYPPGEMHHIFQSLGGSYHLRRVPHDFFNNNCRPSHTMIKHHHLTNYMESFQAMRNFPSN